ncbi:MAG: OmpA family protein [Desulfonatronovibrio sp.]
MNVLSRIFLFILGLALVLGSAGIVTGQTETVIEPKAENFIYYVDNSGSMGFDYEETGKEKQAVAKDLLLAINEELPELEANYGVYTYGIYKEFQPVKSFNRQAMDDAFQAIPEDFDIFGRQTPMGAGLIKLDGPLSRLQDRMAVVVVTDGESNLGPHPKDVMQDMYSRYGNRICFHFISLAQTDEEKAYVDELAGLDSCSVKAQAGQLENESARADFIERVFYDTRTVTVAPEPEPEPKPEPEPAEEVIVFSNINFDFDSAAIKSEYDEMLEEAADIIKDSSDKKVVIEGHTCNIGPAEYNMDLSERRAQSVADFLVDEGISSDRLETEGYGLTKPKFDNDTRQGRALNRRVEMHLE